MHADTYRIHCISMTIYQNNLTFQQKMFCFYIRYVYMKGHCDNYSSSHTTLTLGPVQFILQLRHTIYLLCLLQLPPPSPFFFTTHYYQCHPTLALLKLYFQLKINTFQILRFLKSTVLPLYQSTDSLPDVVICFL